MEIEVDRHLMLYPDRIQAEEYIREAEGKNPGHWVQHSRNAAHCAEIIATHHSGFNPEQAYIFGLLHDIGRREGVTGMRHVLDGYNFLSDEGFEAAARICLTHSYPVEGLVTGAGGWDGSKAELEFVSAYLDSIQYDDYDRLIQLSDLLSMPSGFCLMETRFVDVVMRHGFDEYTVDRWHGFIQVKKRIEGLIGVSVYELLPGIIENTLSL